RDQKCKGGRIFRPCAKASLQKLINRYDAKVIIGLDEDQGDDDTAQQRTESQLCVGKVARGISLFWSTEERGGAGLRRKDRRKHSPPRDVPVPDGEAFHRFFAATLVQADANHNGKIWEKYAAIE